MGCSRNPKYMSGEEEWPGSCRLTCGACKVPPHVSKKAFNKKQVRSKLDARFKSSVYRQIYWASSGHKKSFPW